MDAPHRSRTAGTSLSKRALRDAFEGSAVPGAFLDERLVLRAVNPALCEMLELGRQELLGTSVADLVHPADRAVLEGLGERASGGSRWRPARLRRGDGELVGMELAATVVDGAATTGGDRLFVQLRAASPPAQGAPPGGAEAIHDPLTGLCSKALLLDRAARALARRGREPATVGLVLVGLRVDGPEPGGSAASRRVGDAMIVRAASRLSEVARPSETLARLDDDRLAVLCDDLRDPLEAADRAKSFADALREPLLLGALPVALEVSIGVATASGPGRDATVLLEEAESARKTAGSGGHGQIEVFDRSIRFETLRRLQLEDGLRAALDDGELLLEYQPIVDVVTGRPVALEALARWDHPVRGKIGPNEFVPLAAKAGLAVELGEWVVREALARLGEWQDLQPESPPLKMTVNVSGELLAAPGFAGRVAELLAAGRFAPRSLGIEVTESVVIEVTPAHEVLEALRSIGVLVLLDDFGTGWSSLSYLDRLPIDVLKIDRSFVARLDEGLARSVVLEAICALARVLGLPVVAEGVETSRHVARLRELGCAWVQGFAVAPPLAAADVPGFLAEGRVLAEALDGSR